MERLREFLRTQYIGAIVIAMLAYQGLMSLLGLASYPLTVWAASFQPQQDFLPSMRETFQWQQMVPSAFRGLLYLAFAIALTWWLYAPVVRAKLASTDPAAEELE
jgi:hypothetical protein